MMSLNCAYWWRQGEQRLVMLWRLAHIYIHQVLSMNRTETLEYFRSPVLAVTIIRTEKTWLGGNRPRDTLKTRRVVHQSMESIIIGF